MRIFTRLYGGIVVVLLALFFASSFFLFWDRGELTDNDIEDGFGLGPMLTVRLIADAPDPAIALEELTKEYEYDMYIERASDLPERARQRFRDGRFVAYFQRGESHLVATPPRHGKCSHPRLGWVQGTWCRPLVCRGRCLIAGPGHRASSPPRSHRKADEVVATGE